CDLRHVNVVLCCDPKALTHANPLEGLVDEGAFVWESSESPERAWERIPPRYRQEIIDKRIRLYILPGFDIAKRATPRADLQLRMQGNAFLGAFFRVSPFLEQNGIDQDYYRQVVREQYEKRFGRFGDAVVEANMTVMSEGFELLQEVPYGRVDAADRSSMRGIPLLPQDAQDGAGESCTRCAPTVCPPARPPMARLDAFDAEFRAGLGYHQPASPLASIGVMAAATGATASKFVARRETPLFIAENCTQCMDCIAACPDTALPNVAMDLNTVLGTAIRNYVSDAAERTKLLDALPSLETAVRESMVAATKDKRAVPFKDIVREKLEGLETIADKAKEAVYAITDILPMAYTKTNAVFATVEKKNPGEGGLFAIFVSDHCKGCGECVVECGSHDALRMVPDSEEMTSRYESATRFLDLLPDTPQKYLGLYDNESPQDSRAAALRNHLMVRRNYEALVSGDGACAGCGEKSVLRAVATMTEAYMRPLYHQKADRLRAKADRLEREGLKKLSDLAARDPAEHELFQRAVAHTVMGMGGENEADTKSLISRRGGVADRDLVDALVAVLRQEAFNHKDLQAVDGRLADGMAVMAMGASTGCNTVYGSTPPNNPHPYPWMNSLFQDGATVSWIMGESFILDHARRSIIPERLADALLDRDDRVISDVEYFDYTHMTDASLSDREVAELPKAWAVGGDG
ncbi:MAG: 2-oxoacid:acceptor oxidoreductase family protein, partial [Candidatus Binatia bacterium]